MTIKIRATSRKRDRGLFDIGRLLITWAFFFQAFPGFAQGKEYPFARGESAVYGAYYNWNFIWMNAGEVRFDCDTVSYHGQAAWHLKAVGKTFKAYDLFYTVRDTFETFLSYPGFTPLWFRRVVNHGKGHSSHQYEFLPEQGKIITNIHREKEKPFSDQLCYIPGIHDLLSSAYSFRRFDFDHMQNGQKVTFKMLVDNKNEDLYFRYLGIERIKTRKGRRFLCHKVSVWLLEGDFFPEGEYMKIWFTADRNRLPVMVETKIVVGSVKAILLNEKGLKYPLSSEQK